MPPVGPPGQQRGTGIAILLSIVTFGIYQYFYYYKVHEQMKRHGGTGLGGGIALVLTIVAGIAMIFITPGEIRSLYRRSGRESPVSALTGLWYLLPAVVGGVVAVIVAIVCLAAGTTTAGFSETGQDEISTGAVVGLVVTSVVYVVVAMAGGVIWFVKTNGALNRYWASLGVPA